MSFVISCIGLYGMSAVSLASEQLSTTIIQNSSVYNAGELFDLYSNHIGRPVTDATSTAIAEAVREQYQRDGYSRPGFRVLDGGTESGIVRIRLVEPSISSVSMNGNAGPYRQRVEAMFADLPSGQSIRPSTIRSALRRANQLPGLDVSVSTRPDGEHSGGFVLQVDSAYRSLEGSTSVSNLGTREIGRTLAFARLVRNGMFGGENAGGLFIASAESSNHYLSGGAFVNTALGRRGLSATVHGAATSLEIETSSGVVVDQNRRRLLLKFRYPLHLWPKLQTTVWGSYELDDLDILQDGARSREDRLRSIGSGLTMSWRTGTRQHLLSIEQEQGLNAFGARLDNFLNPDAATEKDYSITELHYVQLATLPDPWTLRLDAFAQYSPDVLPSIKRFKVGGGRIGRGFEAAALNGDRGVGSKLQLGRGLGRRLAFFERAEAYAFFDQGSAWRQDAAGRESASSAGIGFAFRNDHFSGHLDLAKPLTHDDADGRRDANLIFEVSARF